MSGHEDVTWAEVNVSNLLAERDDLRAIVNGSDGGNISAKYYGRWAAERVAVEDLERRLEGRDRVLADRDRHDAAALVLWTAAVEELTGQRDRARALAVRLEQELAVAESPVPVFDPATAVEEPRCESWGRRGMSQVRCELPVHSDEFLHTWGDLTW